MARPAPVLPFALLLLSLLLLPCGADAAGVGTFSLEQTMSVDVGQIGDVTLYMDNTWQPAADDVWVYVYWDGAALGYISTDWKIGNSVSATLKGTNSLFLQMADLTNKYGNGKVAIADINLKALTAGSSPLTIRIDRVRGHTGVSVTNFTDLTPSATANQGTFVVRETPTPPPPVPQRLGAVVSYLSDSNVGRAVVDYVAASDQYGYHTVYRYPDNQGWYRHQSDSGRYQEARTVIEAQDLVIVGHVDTAKPLPIEARYVYPPLKYSIGDIVGEKATGPFRVVTRVDEGGANYYSPGSYTHKLVWMDGQGQWRTYDDSSGETWGDAQTDFESRYSVSR